jgi:hypothetical protein
MDGFIRGEIDIVDSNNDGDNDLFALLVFLVQLVINIIIERDR